MADTKRIKIQANGPYLVSGDVPLSEMAPVHTYNGEPIDWHRLRDFDPQGKVYALCRCGESSNKPFCDGTHAQSGFDGTETADRSPGASRQERLEGPGITVTDDKSLCHSAGFCGTRATNVWKMLEQSDDPAARAKMIEMIRLCPSGRLAYSIPPSGAPEEEDLPQEVAVVPGGPLWVRGDITVESTDGREWEALNRRTLCRCGASKNKPFCDGAHSEASFDER